MTAITLPWPHKALWPNGRAHFMARAREVKKHRGWGRAATLSTKPLLDASEGRVSVTIVASPKPRGPAPDKDNTLAACKAYLDGVADALGVDDRLFDPSVVIVPERRSEITIEVGLHREARPIGEIVAPIVADILKRAEA